ncbi:MAG: hypothetical protein ACOX7Q_03785, partial [Kiritimatiellia bacterium]
VKLRDIYEETGGEESRKADYSHAINRIEQELIDRYTINEKPPEIEWSNLYAFDVELYYPFKPAPVPDYAYLWMSVTTNSPPLFIATRAPYGWLEDYDDDASFGRVLFGRWNSALAATTNAVPIPVTDDIVWSFIQTNAVLLTYVNHPEAFDTATNQTEIATAFSSLWSATYTNDLAASTTNQPFSLALWTTTRWFTNRVTQAVLADDVDTVNTILRTPYTDVNWDDGKGWAETFRELFSKTSAAQFGEYEPFPIEKEHFIDNDFYVYNNTNNLVCFPYAVTNFAENGIDPEFITVRFAPLEDEDEGGNETSYGYDQRKAWLRAMVTVSEIDLPVLDHIDLPVLDHVDVVGIPEPVDEALLLRDGNETNGYYQSWSKAGSLSIDEPRDNAWADKWKWFDKNKDTLGEKNNNEFIAEKPFIHYDRPFLSISELGHVNVAVFANIVDGKLTPDALQNLKHPSGDETIRRDTIDFTTRSGASLLDKFSLGIFKTPTRGLVQANTTDGMVLYHLHSDLKLGWTNWFDSSGYATVNDPSLISDLVDNWTNTLLRSDAYAFDWAPDKNGCPGWSSYADMLPDLGTNLLVHQKGLIARLPEGLADVEGNEYDTYDWTEDILRGIVTKNQISFRQNIFVIVIAAQTLSPVSTPSRPVVLADQRAAVTVIRDAFTGRWTIHDWRWLTE